MALALSPLPAPRLASSLLNPDQFSPIRTCVRTCVRTIAPVRCLAASPRVKKATVNRVRQWVPSWGWDGRAEDAGPFETWLREEGLPPQKLVLDPVMEGERGLVAREAIANGETLLSVPEGLIITADLVYRCPTVGGFLKTAKVPEWPALAVYLLSEAAKGEDSKWKSYIEALPKNPGCILMWSLEEVDTLLEGSPLRQRAIECIADVSDTFKDLEATVFSKNPQAFPPQVFTLGAFKWAFSILFSRMVRLPSLGGRLALVPWADMLNHKCDVGTYLDFDPASRTIVVKTDRRYEKGEEVYVSYGPRPSSDLLLAYGMVPAGANPHDSVELPLGLVGEDPLGDKKRESLEAVGLTWSVRYPVKMEGLPLQLVAFARLVVAGPQTPRETLQELARGAASGGVGGEAGRVTLSPSLEEEIASRELILAACQLALRGYSTTLEKDEEIAEGGKGERDSLEKEKVLQERVRAAAALRSRERKILYRTDASLRLELRELKRLEAKKDGRATFALGNNEQGKGVFDKFLRRIVNPW